MSRPHLTAIVAMSADGKIADKGRSPARFGSAADKAHLETQIAAMDAVIFGANTLRAYGTSLSIRDPKLLAQRQQQGKPSQPIHFVCSASGVIAKDIRFFEQSIPRGLITTPQGKKAWENSNKFEQIIELDSLNNWLPILHQLKTQGIEKIGLLGGSKLIGSFVEQGLIDELFLTVCPIVLGGETAPTWCGGQGFLEASGLKLELLKSETVESEIFIHYRVVR
ncbi:bifunctional deaminase-reductase domain protein [[Leptolyngbya] sp. PCC 7376]|uniref:RibD family protein n=1 Tax=[Leptolyngbya] sp. PCC 7376 TaxID=111781 RepID=UPI00029F458F|nr:RibD family protein [[Leptolyngbya] sp. PCC 7376]AFY40060.1 bifunctional deaminase-reductase domain protein [[Leptolyngbya] sp. PCC 7376]